jgi:hypothetical protein
MYICGTAVLHQSKCVAEHDEVVFNILTFRAKEPMKLKVALITKYWDM